jgi:tRNA-dihydrouridine synthase
MALVDTAQRLRESWQLGSLTVPNRVLLAPLAGIGNWFVRLQAKRYGAGLAVSEMVSSHAVHHHNEKTWRELLRIDPREREPGEAGAARPTSIQLFGEQPEIMRSAAAQVAALGADAIDINMGCPVPKVQKTGAGAALLADPDRAVALARACVEGAREGSAARGAAGGAAAGDPAAGGIGAGRIGAGGIVAGGIGAGGIGAGGIPITVKLRSGLRPGDRSGFDLAHRLVAEAGVAAIGFHPRAATVHHKGEPDYDLAAELVRTLPAPVLLTGGMRDVAHVHAAVEHTGAEAVLLARGALGNPWLFAQLLGERGDGPSREEVLTELRWTMACAREHLGAERAARYLRKFYPWYVTRLELPGGGVELNRALQASATLEAAQELLTQVSERVPEPA